MTHPTFTCVIPAYNEAPRIGNVLGAVVGHPDVQQIIVIDDGSTDGTAAVAQNFDVTVLRTAGNLGKTGALGFGLRGITTSHVLLLDADLTGLTPDDVSALIAPVMIGKAIASISLRGNSPWVWRAIGLDYISGERALPYDMLVPHMSAFDTLPKFGFEVFLNRLLLGATHPIAVVKLPKVASPSKAAKQGIWHGTKSDVLMMRDIFRTVSIREATSQISKLRHRRVR